MSTPRNGRSDEGSPAQASDPGTTSDGASDRASHGDAPRVTDATAAPNPFAAGGAQNGAPGQGSIDGERPATSSSGGFASPDGAGGTGSSDRTSTTAYSPWSPSGQPGGPSSSPSWGSTPTPYTDPYTPQPGSPYTSPYTASQPQPYPAPYPPPAGTAYPPTHGGGYGSGYGGGYGGGYGAVPPYPPPLGGWPTGPATSGLAVGSLVCGIVGFFVLGATSIPAVICGHLAWSDTSEGRASGHGMAIAGLIMGYIQIVIWIGFWILIGVSSGS